MTRAQYAQTYHPSNNPQTTSLPPTHSNSTLNLSVLRRYLPSITNIITIAAYSVIYIFRPSLSNWEKSGIEGTLFVVRLQDNNPPHKSYAIIVLNRRGLDNFVLKLRTSEEVEVTEEYVIVRDDDAIWGLWIFEEEGGSTKGSRERVGGVIMDCARRVERSAVEGRREGGGDLGGQMDGGREYDFSEVRQDQQHVSPEKASGPDLMALLNASSKLGESGVRAERPGGPEHGQALLDLFRKAG